jgi:tetratricopeptide (TPR) repeat protein/tRNA A-37 threonylcarbamoyl transferase component Bud32
MRCLNCHRKGIAPETQVCPQCGVNLPTLLRDLLPSGTVLNQGRYRIDDGLLQDKFGITYQGFDLQQERPITIKEFFPRDYVQRNHVNGEVKPFSSAQEAYQQKRQRFEQEGQILARVTHPGIIKVFTLFSERHTVYWVMEWLEGWTLREELNAQPKRNISKDRTTEVMSALVDALETIHQQGVYHLNLQPSNVLLTMAGQIILTDFGAIDQDLGIVSPSQSNPTGTVSTVDYVAPELLNKGAIGAATDLFELGMMLHELLTGTLPPTASHRLSQDQWQPHTLAEPWRGMVTQALQLPPESRPQDIQAWWQTHHQPSPSRDRHTMAERHADIGLQVQAAIAKAQQEQQQLPSSQPTPPWLKPLLITLGGLAIVSALVGLIVGLIVGLNRSGSENPAITSSPGTFSDLNRSADAKFYRERGDKRYRAGDHKGAVADYSTAIHLNPDDAIAYYRRGNTQYVLGDKKAALADYNQAIRIDPDYADAYAGRGSTKSDLGDKQGGLTDFNKAIQLNPDSVYAYTGRGNVKLDLKDNSEALLDYNQAIQLNPKYSYAYSGRGIVNYNLGNTQKAITDYSRAIELGLNTAEVYNNRGNAKADLGDKPGALKDYNQAIQIAPNYSYAYNGRGNIKAQTGDVDGAIADYGLAIRFDPKNIEAYVSRGVARYRLKDLQGSLADYNKALALKKDHAMARSNIGFVQYDLGERDAAIKSWQDALKLDEKQPDPRMALATALYRMGRKEQALVEAEAALKLNLQFAQVDFLKNDYAWSDQLLADFKPLRNDPKFEAIVRRLKS